jgi:hypothetical protein
MRELLDERASELKGAVIVTISRGRVRVRRAP